MPSIILSYFESSPSTIFLITGTTHKFLQHYYSKLLLRSLSRSTIILPHALFQLLPLVALKRFNVLAVHHPRHFVRLPLLECKPGTGVGVVFGVGLVFVVFDLDKVGGSGGGVEREGDEGVDGRGFNTAGEGPRLQYAHMCVKIICM